MNTYQIVSTIIGLFGVIFGLASWLRNRKTDDADGGKQAGIVLTELGYIKAGVDDMKRKQEAQDGQTRQILVALTAVEASVKSAHHRIDELSDRVKN